jgi:hypothetical protein
MNPITLEERKIVIAQLETSASELHFSSGSGATYTRNEIIERINQEDPVGDQFVRMQLEFMRAFKDGRIAAAIATA